MRQSSDSAYIFPAVFAPVVSLDALCASEKDVGLQIADDAPTPDAIVEQQDSHRALHTFLETLSDRELEIVRAIYWQDETQADVARRFGVSKMAISKSLARILDRARRSLAPAASPSKLTH